MATSKPVRSNRKAVSLEKWRAAKRRIVAEREKLKDELFALSKRPSGSDAVGYFSSPKGRRAIDIQHRIQKLDRLEDKLDKYRPNTSTIPTVTLTDAEMREYLGKSSDAKAQYPSIEMLVTQAPGFTTKLQLAAEVLADAAATAKAAELTGAASAAQTASAALQSAAHQAGIRMRAISGYAETPYESVLNLASAIAALNALYQQLTGVPGGEGLLRAVYGARMQAAGVRERLKGVGGKSVHTKLTLNGVQRAIMSRFVDAPTMELSLERDDPDTQALAHTHLIAQNPHEGESRYQPGHYRYRITNTGRQYVDKILKPMLPQYGPEQYTAQDVMNILRRAGWNTDRIKVAKVADGYRVSFTNDAHRGGQRISRDLSNQIAGPLRRFGILPTGEPRLAGRTQVQTFRVRQGGKSTSLKADPGALYQAMLSISQQITSVGTQAGRIDERHSDTIGDNQGYSIAHTNLYNAWRFARQTGASVKPRSRNPQDIGYAVRVANTELPSIVQYLLDAARWRPDIKQELVPLISTASRLVRIAKMAQNAIVLHAQREKEAAGKRASRKAGTEPPSPQVRSAVMRDFDNCDIFTANGQRLYVTKQVYKTVQRVVAPHYKISGSDYRSPTGERQKPNEYALWKDGNLVVQGAVDVVKARLAKIAQTVKTKAANDAKARIAEALEDYRRGFLDAQYGKRSPVRKSTRRPGGR